MDQHQTTPDTQSTHGRTLTQQTSRGFFWMLLQTIGSKPVTLVGQLILADLLLNEQWGLVGLAFSVSVWAELLQQAGLREILVRKHAQFAQWANAAFWLAQATGALALGLLLLCTPLAVRYYDNPHLTGLIYTMALAIPINALSIVPDARLQVQLRFRAIAAIAFTSGVGSILLSIVLAIILPEHLGAYAFAIPYTVFAGVRAAAVWWLAPVRIRLRPEFGLWGHMVPDSVRLFLGSALQWATNMAGVIVLGRMHTEAEVGDFWFATLIAAQVSMLESNLQQVLLPSLSRLQNEPTRMREAFLRAARGIELVGAPAGVIVAAMADPGLRAVFGEKWVGAILPLQALGLGVAMRMTCLSSVALMKAGGRFNGYLALYAMWAVVFALLAWQGAKHFEHGAVGVALATMVFYSMLGPVNTFVAIRPMGGRVRDVLGVFAPAMFCALAGIGGAMALATLIPDMPLRSWVQMAVIGIVGLPVCFALQCLLAPHTVAELLSQASHMLDRLPGGGKFIRLTRKTAATINPRKRLLFVPSDASAAS